MKIKFTTSISSSLWGAHGPGETCEVPDDEAKNLIAAGYAEPVPVAKTREKAVRRDTGKKAVRK